MEALEKISYEIMEKSHWLAGSKVNISMKEYEKKVCRYQCCIKGEHHAKYKLLSYERAFKMQKNDMCVTVISQAILKLWGGLNMNKGILKPVGECRFWTFRTPQ